MLCREITAIFSQIHTKHINTQCGQNVELLNVKPPQFKGLNRVMLNNNILWNVTPCSLVAEEQCAVKLPLSSAVFWNNLLPWTWKITAIIHAITFRKTDLHSHRCDNLKYCRDFNIAGGRGVQIPDVESPRQLN